MHIQPNRLVSYALPDYRQLKKTLGFSEDTYLNFTELTSKYGYKSEEHTVSTEDGYLLTVFRLLPKCNQRQRFPVILAHGIYDSSDAWILTGPQTGLGYILATKCYDVWAANLRGNVYSRKHIRLDPDKDPEYWEFSFDEIGRFDLPAIIDYVLGITAQSKTYYIGHSQGSTDFFVMGSLRPEYNDKIRLSILLAPVAWMKNLKSVIPKIIARQTKNIKDFLYTVGFRELFAKQQLIHAISEILCQYFPQEVCGTALALTTGYVRGSITSKNLAVVIGHLLVGVSVKTLAHFGQLIVSQKFQRFDEGKEINIKTYGTVTPPQYNVSLITSPIVLVCAENDWVSSLRDINILQSRLPNVVEKYIVPEPTWSHNNHLWGVNATEYVFDKILNYFDKFDT
ncbi:lipase 1-like [Nymphalis io]|uniref:lipase 1-like n=1 Tax=Inachis io TaxID=171585 RepID=UPI002168C575|nr:lipase 1-like [Nymphalis io]